MSRDWALITAKPPRSETSTPQHNRRLFMSVTENLRPYFLNKFLQDSWRAISNYGDLKG